MRDHAALIALLESRARRPHEWGSDKHDCVSFPAAAVLALTGDDPLRRLGVSWTTELGGRRIIRRFGGIAACADAALTRLPAPAFAHRGDIGLVSHDGVESLGVIEAHLVVMAGVAGLVRLPRGLVTAAWSAEWTG